jgi:hypothetical protein
MEGEESPELAAALKKEKQWFRGTVGFTAGSFLGVIMGGGAPYWRLVRLEEAFPGFSTTRSVTVMSGPADTDALRAAILPPNVLALAALVIILICGIGFLVSLVKWLLAIRHRRALHAAGFASPAEARDSELEREGKGE